MRIFLLALEDVALGIPTDAVAKIIPAPPVMCTLIAANSGRGDVFFSALHFFNRKTLPSPHGIVLKRCTAETAQLRKQTGKDIRRLILLIGAIETEIDLSDEHIQQMPSFFSAKEQLRFISGATFTDTGMIIIIDPAALVSCIISHARHV